METHGSIPTSPDANPTLPLSHDLPWVDWLWSADEQGVVTSCVFNGAGSTCASAPLEVGRGLWQQLDVAWSPPGPDWMSLKLRDHTPMRNLWGLWIPTDSSRNHVVLCGDFLPHAVTPHWQGGLTVSDAGESTTPARQTASSRPAVVRGACDADGLNLHLEQALAAARQSFEHLALVVVNFSNAPNSASDSRGTADSFPQIQHILATLEKVMRPHDAWARLGDGEWGLLISDLDSDHVAAANVARQVTHRLMSAIGGIDAQFGAPKPECVAGIAVLGPRTPNAASALSEARHAVALQRSPSADGVSLSDPALQAKLNQRATLESEFKTAIAQSELRLFYQPVVNIHASTIGAEALVRWQHPKNGLISPAHFIGMAEETGLIIPMGWWVLRAACQQLAEWARVPYKASWTIAVNVSAKQFLQNNFVDEVQSILAETGINPRRLKLELTESVMVQHVEDAIAKMSVLQAQGIKFSLDDFGTGYSSLSYLKRLPLQQLKIDQSFVRDIHNDPNDAAIVKTILALAHSMELSVVAEGVETLEQEEFLIAAGCRYMQGYLYGRPVPVSQWT